MSKIATKLIWSITPFGVQQQGIEKIIDILEHNQLSIVRATYSEFLEPILHTFQKRFIDSNETFDPTFLFELVGRRCLVAIPVDSTSHDSNVISQKITLVDGNIIDIKFDVDFDFCAQNKIAQSSSSMIEMKVSSSDQLKFLEVGSILNISYGAVRLKIVDIVKRTKNTLQLKCKVIEGGSVFSGMKVHSSDISRDLFPLLKQDKAAIQKKFHKHADYLLLSGLKTEEEIHFFKKMLLGKSLKKSSKRHPSVPITSDVFDPDKALPPRFLLKIDSKHALDLMPKVLSFVDGIVLSRSEIGLDEHPHNLGILQKKIIEICNQNGKAIIVSSEMMRSMRQNPTPTRAEVTDMANAMEDGADALVLPSEITQGPYAELVAHVSRNVLAEAEAWKAKKWGSFETSLIPSDDDIIIYGAIRIAEQSDAKAIVCFTEGGYTAYKLSATRTPKNIIAFTYNKRIFRQLALLHAVQPVLLNKALQTEKLLFHIKQILIDDFEFKLGEEFVFVSFTRSSVSSRHSNLFSLQTT